MAGSGMNYNHNNHQFADTSSLFGGPDPTSSTSFFDAIPQNSNASPPPPTANSHSSPPQKPNSPPSRPLATSPSQQPQQQQVVGEASNLFTNDASALFSSQATDVYSSQTFMTTPVASFPSTSPSPPNPALNTAPQVSSPPHFAEQPTTQALFAGPDSSSFFDNLGSSIPAAQQQYQAQYSHEQPSYEQQSTLPANSSESAASSYNYDYNYSQNQSYGVSPQSFHNGYTDQYPQPEGQPQQGYADTNGVTYQAQTDYSAYQQYQYQQSAYDTSNTQNYISTPNDNYQYDQYQSAHPPASQSGSTQHQEYASTQYQERQSAQNLASDSATTQSYDTSQQYSTIGGQHSGYHEYSYPTSAAVGSIGADSTHSNVVQSMVPDFESESTPATIPAVIEDSTADTGSLMKAETHREENTNGEISTDQKIAEASVEPNVKSGTTDYTPAQTNESGIPDEFEDITNSTVASNNKTEPKNAPEYPDSQTQASQNEIADLDDLVFGVNQMKVSPDSATFTTAGKVNSSGGENLISGENGSRNVQKESCSSVEQTRSNDVSGLFGDNGSNSSASFFSMPQPDQTAADTFATDNATSQMQASGAFTSTMAKTDMTASSYSASTDPQQWGQPASSIVHTGSAPLDSNAGQYQIPEYNRMGSSLDNTVSQTDPFGDVYNASKIAQEQAIPGHVNDGFGANGIGTVENDHFTNVSNANVASHLAGSDPLTTSQSQYPSSHLSTSLSESYSSGSNMYATGDTASMYSVYQSSSSSSPKPTTHGFVASGGSFIQSNINKNDTSSLSASDMSQTQMPVDYGQQNGQEGWHGHDQAVPETSYSRIDSTARPDQSNKTQAAATPSVSSKYDSYVAYSNSSMNSPMSATPSMNDVTPTQQMFSNSPPFMAAPIQRPSSTPPQSAVFAASNTPGYTNYSTSSVTLTSRSTRTLSQPSQPISAPPQRPSSTPPQSNRSPSSPLSQSFVPSDPNAAANVTSVGSAATYSSQPIISPHQRPSSTPPQSNIIPSPPFSQSFIPPSNEHINGTSIGLQVSVPSLQSVPHQRPSSTPPVTSAGIVGSGARRYQSFVPPTSSVLTTSMSMSTDLTSQNATVSGYYQGAPSTFSQPQQDFSNPTFASYNNQDLANSSTPNIPTPTQSAPNPTPLAPTRSNSAPPTNVYASLPVRKRSISTPSPLKNLTTLNESTEFGDGVGNNIGSSSNQVQGGATPNVGSAEYSYAYGVASTALNGVTSNPPVPIPVPNQDHSYNYQPQSQYQNSQSLPYSSNSTEGTYASSPASSSFSVDSEATYKPRNTGGNGTGSIYSDRSVTPTPSFKNSGYENQSPIIKCQTCGVELASFSRFCNLCGTPVPAGTQISSSQISPVRDNKAAGINGAPSATSGAYQNMSLSNTVGQASTYYGPNANVDPNTGYYQNTYDHQQQDPGFMGQFYNQAGFDQNNSMPLYTSTAEYSSYQQPNQNQIVSEYDTAQPFSSSSPQAPTHRGPSHPSERLPEHQPARIPILNFTATGKVVVMFPKATFRYSSSPGINKSGDGISSNQNGTLKVYPGEIAIKAVKDIVGITDGGFGVSQKELDILRRIKEWSSIGPLISCGDVTAKQKEKESYIESKKKAILDILKVWEAQNDAEIQILMDHYQVDNPQLLSQNGQVGSSSPNQNSNQVQLVCHQDRKVLLLWLKSIVSNISASFVANPSSSNVKKLAGSFGLHKRGGSFNALDWLSSGSAGSNHKKSGSIDSTNSSISVNSNGIASAEKEEKARSNDELMVELLLNMVKPLLISSNSTSSPPPSSTTTPYLTSSSIPSETNISASLSSSSHGLTTTNSVGGLSRDLFMMYQFLVMGKRIEAVKFANEKGLYPHALLIASCVSKDVWVETVKRFTRSLGDESASASENDLNELGKGIPDGSYTQMRQCCLKMIYQLFAPVGKDAVGEVFPSPEKNVILNSSQLSIWREALLLVLANNVSDQSNVLTTMGDRLRHYGRLDAAAICHLLSPATSKISGLDHPNCRQVLLTADHITKPSTIHHNILAFQLTEIWEFILSCQDGGMITMPVNSNDKFAAINGTSSPPLTPNVQSTFLPHFQAYKIAYASLLADLGLLEQSRKYCESLGYSLRWFTAAFSLSSPPPSNQHPPQTPQYSTPTMAGPDSSSIQMQDYGYSYINPTLILSLETLSDMLGNVNFDASNSGDKSGAGSWFAKTLGLNKINKDSIFDAMNRTMDKFVTGEDVPSSANGSVNGVGVNNAAGLSATRGGLGLKKAATAQFMSGLGSMSRPGSVTGTRTFTPPPSKLRSKSPDGFKTSVSSAAGSSIVSASNSLVSPNASQSYTESQYSGYSSSTVEATSATNALGYGYSGYNPQTAPGHQYQSQQQTSATTTATSIAQTQSYGYSHGYYEQSSSQPENADQTQYGYSGYASTNVLNSSSNYPLNDQNQPYSSQPYNQSGYIDSHQSQASPSYQDASSQPRSQLQQQSMVQTTQQEPAPSKRRDYFDDMDDDLGLGNTSSKKESSTPAQANSDNSAAKDAGLKGDSKNDEGPSKNEVSGSIFGFLKSALPFGGGRKSSDASGKKAVKANLGETNQFYYDEKLKKWVNKNAPADEQKESPLPPPPRATTPSVPTGPNPTPAPSAQPSRAGTPVGGLPPSRGSTPIPNSLNNSQTYGAALGGSRLRGRSKYVDVLNPSGGSSGSGNAPPAAANFLPVAPVTNLLGGGVDTNGAGNQSSGIGGQGQVRVFTPTIPSGLSQNVTSGYTGFDYGSWSASGNEFENSNESENANGQ